LPENLAKIAEEGYTFAPGPPPRLVVYTDGSGLGNGKKGALAGLGVFWGGTGKAAKNNLAERVPGPLQTNNRGELLV
jgi:ribonuclease HI